jgi:hypothetical protein
MRKDLDRLAAEDECGDTVETVRGHDDRVALLSSALSMIARQGCSCSTWTLSHVTPLAQP